MVRDGSVRGAQIIHHHTLRKEFPQQVREQFSSELSQSRAADAANHTGP